MDLWNSQSIWFMQIKKLFDDIISVLPAKFHCKVKICSSYPEMIRVLVERDKIKKDYKKVSTEFCEQIKNDKEYNKRYESSLELSRRYPRRRQLRGTSPIVGFNGNPILLNRGVLCKESKYFVAAVILHEIGHNAGYLSEGGADKFALVWMKVVEKIIKERDY